MTERLGLIFSNEQICDPSYLPSREELISRVHGHLLSMFGNNLEAYDKDLKTLEPTYPAKFGYRHGMFELLNREGVTKLTRYLGDSALRICPDGDKVRIANVGAGLGRLKYFVDQAALDMGIDNLDIVDSDYGVMVRDLGLKVPFEVLNETYQQTLRRHKPQIVISSWMDKGSDWTPAFRNTASVEEYVLMGKPGICGTPASWAERKKGFSRHTLYDLCETQVGFRDDLFPYNAVGASAPGLVYTSGTVSFRRVETNA